MYASAALKKYVPQIINDGTHSGRNFLNNHSLMVIGNIFNYI